MSEDNKNINGYGGMNEFYDEDNNEMEKETEPLQKGGNNSLNVRSEDEIITKEFLELEKNSKPKDFFGVVFLIFLLQGIGCLFPFNAFISAPDYFNKVYGPKTIFYISIAFSYPNILGVLFMTFFGHKLPMVPRVFVSYVIDFIILICVPILGFLQMFNTVGLIATLGFAFICALVTSVIQGSIFGLAGKYPQSYMTAVMSGNGWAGVGVSLLRVITKLVLERPSESGEVSIQTLTISSSIYFFISAFIIFGCIVSYLIMFKFKFVKYYIKLAEESLKKEKRETIKKKIIEIKKIKEEEDMNKSINNDGYNDENSEVEWYFEQFEKITNQGGSSSGESGSVKAGLLGIWGIIKIFLRIWDYALLLLVNFMVTLSIFPGLCSRIPSYWGGFMTEWLPIILITLFNIMDAIGRTLPKWIIILSRNWVGPFTLLRVIFIPLFIICVNPRFLYWDIFPIIIMVFMGITNGYCSTLLMMYAPGRVKPHERETAGTMMTLFLLTGIALGSNSGLIWTSTILS